MGSSSFEDEVCLIIDGGQLFLVDDKRAGQISPPFQPCVASPCCLE